MTTKEQKEQAATNYTDIIFGPTAINYQRTAKESAFVAGAEWAESKMRWIPVEEALPEAGQRILLWEGHKVMSGWYDYNAAGELRFWSDDYFICFPTHWQPLPAPPAKEDGEK